MAGHRRAQAPAEHHATRVGQPTGDRQLGREFIRPPEIRGNLWRRLVNSERGAMTDISTSQAQHVVNEAMRKAVEIDTLMNIAVVDAGGNLKAFARMDGAWLGSIDISIRKARTARYFDMNTGDLGALSQPGGSLYNIEVSNGGLITFPGGIPLRDGNGEIIGGIGVSGSIVENDHTVAEAGAKSLS